VQIGHFIEMIAPLGLPPSRVMIGFSLLSFFIGFSFQLVNLVAL